MHKIAVKVHIAKQGDNRCGEIPLGRQDHVRQLIGRDAPRSSQMGQRTRDAIRISCSHDRLGRGGADDALEVLVRYPAPLLERGLVLVDTPGVNDLEDARAEVTYGYVPRADAVLFLLDDAVTDGSIDVGDPVAVLIDDNGQLVNVRSGRSVTAETIDITFNRSFPDGRAEPILIKTGKSDGSTQ